MKIYVITKGEYSSYHICAVATDPAKADQLAEFYSDRYDTASVEEYDTEDVPDLTKGKSVFLIRFDKRGNVDTAYENPEDWDDNAIGMNANGAVWMYVQADTKVDAIKIGAERRAKFLAEQMGL